MRTLSQNEQTVADALTRIGAAARRSEVSAETVAATRAVAHSVLQEKAQVSAPVPPAWGWRPALAWAAALVVAVGVIFGLRPPRQIGPDQPPGPREGPVTEFSPDAEIMQATAEVGLKLHALARRARGAQASLLEASTRALEADMAIYTLQLENELSNMDEPESDSTG